jgi:outer membrane protein TolC
MYPSLTLSGNISTDATQINQWFNLPSSLIWSVVGGLTQPIFNGRALRTQKEVAKKDYEIAIIEFKESILNAGMEVSNTLSALNNNSEKADLLYKQFTVLDKAYEYSYLLFVNGYATYLDVLTAQEGVFDAQLSYIQCLNDVINNHIDLYRALGGGWNKPENNNNK